VGKVCFDCHELIFKAMEAARDEVDRRADEGESMVSLCVEYSNRLHDLIKSEHEDEEYWFLREACRFCEQSLGASKILDEGWSLNRSGRWVKNVSELKA